MDRSSYLARHKQEHNSTVPRRKSRDFPHAAGDNNTRLANNWIESWDGVAKNEQNNCLPFRGLQNTRHTISPQLAQHHNMLAWKPQITPRSSQPGILPLGTLGVFSKGPQESLASDWMLARDPGLWLDKPGVSPGQGSMTGANASYTNFFRQDTTR